MRVWSRRTSTPIHELPTTLFEHICVVYLAWPFDLHGLTLVSRSFNRHATPVLYRTVCVSHENPTSSLALLRLLQSRPEYAAMVQVFVLHASIRSAASLFDPDAVTHRRGIRRKLHVDRVGPNLPLVNESMTECAILLGNVIPDLKACLFLTGTASRADRPLQNLREVVMRSVHPALVSAGCRTTVYYASRWKRLKKKFSVGPETRPYFYFWHTDNASPFWTGLEALERGRTAHIDRLSVALLDRSCLMAVAPFYTLRVLHLSFWGYALPQSTWNNLILTLDTVDTVCLTRTPPRRTWRHTQAEASILRLFNFNNLRSVQAYNLVLADEDAIELRNFLTRHADTIEEVAMSVRYQLRMLSERMIPFPRSPQGVVFPRLQTLRLENVEQATCAGCRFRRLSSPHTHDPTGLNTTAHTAQETADDLARFIAAHTTITDLVLTGIYDTTALASIEASCQSRVMRNVLFGERFDQLLSGYAGGRRGDWRCGLEKWMFNEVIFNGLELTRPEYVQGLVGIPRGHLAKQHW